MKNKRPERTGSSMANKAFAGVQDELLAFITDWAGKFWLVQTPSFASQKHLVFILCMFVCVWEGLIQKQHGILKKLKAPHTKGIACVPFMFVHEL